MKPKQEEVAKQSVARTIELIDIFSDISRKHGLLGLERYVTGREDFLSRLAMLSRNEECPGWALLFVLF